METTGAEEYLGALKSILYTNRDASKLWTYIGADASHLTRLIFKVKIPCAILNENEACVKNALTTLSKSIVEAECMMECALADNRPSEYTDQCIKCIVELNRQKKKLIYDLQYLVDMKMKREVVLKRKRGEEE